LAVGLAALGLFGSPHHPAGSGVLVALRNVAGLDVGRAFGFAMETLMGFVFQGFSTFLPAYLSERAQIPGLTLALGVGSLASGAMGFVGQRFGLPAVFMVLGMVAVGATGMVFWFGHVVGAWPRKTVQAVTPPLPDSRSARH
jgi:uncharacterized membrane protein (UPF0136 family)